MLHETGGDPGTPRFGVNCDIQDMTFICDQPPAQIADNRFHRAIGGYGHRRTRER